MHFDPLTDYGQHNLRDADHLLKWNFSELIKTLITLAADPERQMDIIGESENPGEEMVLDFESFYDLSAKKYIQAKLIRFDQAEQLDELGAMVARLDEESFSSDSVFDDEVWTEIRNKSNHILQSLGMDDLDLKIEESEKEEEKPGGEKRHAIHRRRVIVRK
ncbi:hypothetical protein [Pollutibacter soli]|uniref:hypothetical protein n=1 Tax=Pollutibacter soli TaxID=3034157 RepID=UPI0030141350